MLVQTVDQYGKPVRMSQGNAISYHAQCARRAIRQARTYHASAFAAGPNFAHCTRTEFRALARLCLMRAAAHRRHLCDAKASGGAS